MTSRPVTLLEQRARALRRARRAEALRRLSRVMLVVLPLVTLGWVLFSSSWLAVREVEVAGERRTTAEQVRAAAQVPLGTPLARVDTGALVDRVRELAPVADVSVQRSWPGTLRIEVTERTAVAGVLEERGTYRLYDGSAVGFATAPERPPGVVRLQVPAPGPADATTRAALAVHASLPAELRDRVRIVRAASPSSVVLLLDTGKQVLWGSPGRTAEKVAAAQALLAMPGDVFDVSAPGVVTRRVTGPAAPTDEQAAEEPPG